MKQSDIPYIAKANCIPHHVYRLRARNLKLGVWDHYRGGFIGIRTKFDEPYLAVEFHWDKGPPFGTARPIEDTGVIVTESIPLIIHLGPIDFVTGRPCEFDQPVAQGGRGWYDVETGKPLTGRYVPMTVKNGPLFDVLAKLV